MGREVKEYTHSDLVKMSAAYLARDHCVVATELSTQTTQECPDAIGWDWRGTSTLIECKTSLGDFTRDVLKISRIPGMGVGLKRYFAAPPGLLTKRTLPSGWGLLEARPRGLVLMNHGGCFEANIAVERTFLVQIARNSQDPAYLKRHNVILKQKM